jgi:hypothetical protein
LSAKDQKPRFIKRRLDLFVIGASHASSSQSMVLTSAREALRSAGRLSK